MIDLNNLNIDLLEIESINSSENYTVDIEVDNDHYYILDNGIVSHNSISLISEVTSGIEPLFAKAFKRKDRVSERIYIHPRYEEKLLTDEKNEKEEDWFVDALNDLSPEDHFEIQVAVQRYVDGSVSKTINLPNDITEEDLSQLLLEYIKDLKGVTVYKDGSREGQILNKISKKEVLDYLKNKKELNVKNNLTTDDVKCPSGKCDL